MVHELDVWLFADRVGTLALVEGRLNIWLLGRVASMGNMSVVRIVRSRYDPLLYYSRWGLCSMPVNNCVLHLLIFPCNINL